MKLICFDLDGVLVDACNLHKLALEQAMQEKLGFIISEEDHKTKFNGLPTKKKLEVLGVDPVKIKEVNERKQEITVDLINKSVKWDDEKVQMMNKLKFHHGLKISVVTNSIRKTAELMLTSIGVLPYINLLISNEDIKNAKPSPEGYNSAMDMLRVNANDTLIVEDSPHGIEAAKASKGHVIEVAGPHEVTYEAIKKYL